MKRSFIHNTLFRLLAPVIYGVMIYLLVLLINNNVSRIDDIFSSQEVYLCILLTYLSFEATRLGILLLGRFTKERYGAWQMSIQFIVTLVFSLIPVLAGLHLYFEYRVGFSISGTQLLIFAILYGITSAVYNVLYFSSYYLQKENTLKIAAEKQNRDVLEMEILAFKNDINPDLLYESLENLITLMYRDVEKAEDYIDCLASAYRYVLANRQQELVPIAVEMDAARNLIKLLNENYHHQVKFESELNDDEMQAMLIPGSIPVIVESLVRNTIISRFETLTVRCYPEDDYITFQCKLNDKLLQHDTSNLALARLQKSYALYSDRPVIMVKAYEENYIKLPVIRISEDAAII